MDELNRKPAAASISISQDQRPATCDEHGDYVSKGFSLGRATRWMGCPACAERVQAAEATASALRAAEESQRRLEARLDRSGIPLRYRSKTFQSFRADTDGKMQK